MMKMHKRIFLLLSMVLIFNILFINSDITYAKKYKNEVPLITFVNNFEDEENMLRSIESYMYHEVEVNDVFLEAGELRIGDRIIIDLPDYSVYTGVIDKIETDINDVYTVRGYIEDNEYDYFLISSKDDKSVGTINLVEEDEKYLINYNSEMESHVIYGLTPEDMDIVHSEPLIPPKEDTDDLNEEMYLEYMVENDVDELVTIDLMLVYTPAAEEWASYRGGIDSIIAQAMANSQLVLDNSEVNINLRLVHSQMVQYRESKNASLDLERITYRSDGYMDEVHQLRDKYGADLVALIGDIGFNGGIGWLLTSPNGRADYAFTVNSVRVIDRSNTLVHEIGHNMGAHHSRNQYESPAGTEGGLFPYSTGWRWNGFSGRSYSSVMTYEEGSARVPMFSNPDVKWDGVPTGSYSGSYAPADNARGLREIKHVVSNYRGKEIDDIPIKSLTLDKSDLFLLTDMTEKLTVSVDPYVSRHDFKWKSSNSSVAKVDSNGEIVAVSPGVATITVSYKNGSKSASCKVTVEKDLEIIFPDAKLEESIRDNLYIHSGPILRSDVMDIGYLYLSNSEISSIEGLQYFDNLENLYISDNQIQDLSPLRELTNLNILDGDYNLITDLYPLRKLTNLRYLSMGNNNISDITPLENITELETLDLSDNSISEIKALENMEKLTVVYFRNNKIKDISPIKVNADYSYYIFDYNKISDLSSFVAKNSEHENYESYIGLQYNYLDTTDESKDMNDIQILSNKGYIIDYIYQREPISATTVILSENLLELETGEKYSLSATIIPSDATNQDLIWSSNNDSVAKVDKDGKITAVSPGFATINVSTNNGVYASCEVKVIKGYDRWNDTLTTTSPNHPWTIKFSMPLDEETVDETTAYIVDEYDNKQDFINVSIKNDEEFGYIRFNNNGEFERNKRYWIVIEDSVSSYDGVNLKRGLKVEFCCLF